MSENWEGKKKKNSNWQLPPMDFVKYHEEIQKKKKKRIEISNVCIEY
jgi:hypothetical protein